MKRWGTSKFSRMRLLFNACRWTGYGFWPHCPEHHSGQTYNSWAISAMILRRKIQTNVESFTWTAKLNAVSENLSFSRWVCAWNEVTVMHKFCRLEIRFAGTCSASFSYELRARKLLNWLKRQGSERPDVTYPFAFDRCEVLNRISNSIYCLKQGLKLVRLHDCRRFIAIWLVQY